ncbi:MAG TPA: PIG-L deacetylase family protein [Terracidiphilus sp.]|nr:PIG-L deacetylase family protein [Terracidiphilus sp.]
MCDVLVVIAHPDDEIFASGTICLCAESGFRIALACVTNGGGGGKSILHKASGLSLAEIRTRELALSAAALGIHEVKSYGFPDIGDPSTGRDAWNQAELIDMLSDQIKHIGPELILTHGPAGGYGHPAHKLTFLAVNAAAQQSSYAGSIFSFCARPPQPFFSWHFDQRANVVIDARRFCERRAASLGYHQSQIDYFLQPYFPQSLRKYLSAFCGYLLGWTEFGRKRIPIGTPIRFFSKFPLEGLALQFTARTGEPHFFAKHYVDRDDVQIDK